MAATSASFEAEVVGPYLVEIDTQSSAPIVRREAIRADREPTFDYMIEHEQRQAA